jgi:hypothetical protein
MQPFDIVIIFNKTTCFGKIKFPSSGPRSSLKSYLLAILDPELISFHLIFTLSMSDFHSNHLSPSRNFCYARYTVLRYHQYASTLHSMTTRKLD